ncbi:hypothetical protein Ddye_026431 [Dipteronia dyeriana]|uniref:Uncharacterized protein n=1 Tax=Dipteronia dyeriana TaxID=168575 RepID=A0AAD9TM86_9ROSI|nr:hypothetical protein Ddye_026431 [Dipteronia dyeriana]
MASGGFGIAAHVRLRCAFPLDWTRVSCRKYGSESDFEQIRLSINQSTSSHSFFYHSKAKGDVQDTRPVVNERKERRENLQGLYLHPSASRATISRRDFNNIFRICFNDQWFKMALMGRFAGINNKEITILVNDAEKSSDIDSKEAKQTLEIVKASLRKAERKIQRIEGKQI